MERDVFYLECKSFLDNFEHYLDYNEIKEALSRIASIDYEIHGCDYPLHIEFIEDERLGNMGKVDNHLIYFNSLRIETLKKLRIDCFDEGHLEKIYKFYNNYNNKKTHNKYEKCLYDFMDRYISIGAEKYFKQMGSYKNTKFELLETILHEDQHIFQSSLRRKMNDGVDLNASNPLDVFIAVFSQIYSKLNENNIPFEYERVNYIYPIEFDARYNAMLHMQELRKNYYKNDKIMKRAIVNSNIIPEDINIKEVSEGTFDKYLYLYDIYDANFENSLDKCHKFLLKNKENIIKELIYRYKTMLDIVKDNQI